MNSFLNTCSLIKLFGYMPDGAVVNSCELTNKNGIQLKVITYGATITSLKIPLKNDKFLDVVLGSLIGNLKFCFKRDMQN